MLRRRIIAAALIVLGTTSGTVAQNPPRVGFEVASIRHIEYTDQVRDEVLAGTRRPRMVVTGNRVSITYMSLAEILRRAFRVEPWAMWGPDWLDQVRFDIEATIPNGANTDLVPEMLQSLLVQRFDLVTRRESREVSGQALITRGNRSEVRVREMTAEELAEMARQRETAKPDAQTIRTEGSTTTFTPMPDGQVRIGFKGKSMTDLARDLTFAAGRPVIDRTGLRGRYEFTLEFSEAGLQQLAGAFTGGSTTAASDPGLGLGSMVEAVQRLGLRLESARVPIDVLVIEKMSRTATPN